MRGNSFLYALLKPPVNWACRLFYRNLHVRDSNRVCDKKAPMLLVSNHQNALLDPLLCCISSPRQLNFLTRADVFKNPMASRLLKSVNMLPVYRPHDKVNIIESNAPTFRESLTRLENNQIISLFPEGTHQKDQNLKTFKKGAARLIGNVFDAGNKTEVIIQPVGLHFTNIMHSGFPGFVQFGEPLTISMTELNMAESERSKTVLALTNELRDNLLACMVHIENDQDYTKKLFIFRAQQWSILFSKKKSSVYEFKALEDGLGSFLQEVNEFSDEEIKDVEESSYDMPALALAANPELKKKFSKKLLALIPIYIFGYAATIIPYTLGNMLSKLMVKDIHFTSTAKIISGFLIIPIFWALISAVILLSFPLIPAVLFCVFAIFSGAIFLKYHTSYRILSRANSISRSPKFSSLISSVKAIIKAS